MQLEENFSLSEFACKDGRQVPKEYMGNVTMLAKNLQALRDEVKEPIHINSSYRPTDYNAKVGGAKDSQHLTASAADLTVKSLSPKKLKAVIEKMIKAGKMKQGGIGLYPGFVHYDIRHGKARWQQ